MMLERALVIRSPWIELILEGKKTWEMRSEPIRIRGPIGLIRRGSGLVVGTAVLTDCGSALSRDDYMRYQDKHAVPEAMLNEVLTNRWIFPWVLADVQRLPRPVAYRHKSGAVKFVTLEPSVAAEIAIQFPGAMPAEDRGGMLNTGSSVQNTPSPVATRSVSRSSTLSFTASPDKPVFVCRAETAQAYGRPLPNDEFIVLEGSTAMRDGSPKVKRDRPTRDRLVREGVLVPDTHPNRYRFTRDYVFNSCSQAAGVVKDGNASGPSHWKNETTGQTLKDYVTPN